MTKQERLKIRLAISNYSSVFLRKGIYNAALAAYKSEVVSTDMEHITIGDGNEYESKADWILGWIHGIIED